MDSYNKKYSEYLTFFEDSLNTVLDSYFGEEKGLLSEAMTYAVSGGGKRIRPVLCLSVAEMLNLSREEVINHAISIELIHSYSLVHDDLPSMDNDDYRRGKLSTHKKYGEANGILVGDALLNLAFEISLNKPFFNQNDIKALKFIANCSGAKGMVLGQIYDLQNENHEIEQSKELLFKIYENKTAKLIMAPILTSSILANNKYYDELYKFSYNLGILFQITDDILDVEGTLELIGKTPNKDSAENKLTAVKIFGIDGAKALAKEFYENCKKSILDIPNNEFLLQLTDKIYNRNK